MADFYQETGKGIRKVDLYGHIIEDVMFYGTSNLSTGFYQQRPSNEGWGVIPADEYVFDVSNLQSGDGVCCSLLSIYDFDEETEYPFSVNLLGSTDGNTRVQLYSYTGGYYENVWAMICAIDNNGIKPGIYGYYRWEVRGSGSVVELSTIFTLGNPTPSPEGYLRVEGGYLCYTDNSGTKHTLPYDSGYSSVVGTDKKGYVWLEDSDYLRIYYIDEYGVKRRTDASESGGGNVGSGNKGFMWVGENDNYLRFIGPNGDKRKITDI